MKRHRRVKPPEPEPTPPPSKGPAISFGITHAYRDQRDRTKVTLVANVSHRSYRLPVRWDFGDGVNEVHPVDATVVHRYLERGTYLVRIDTDAADPGFPTTPGTLRLDI